MTAIIRLLLFAAMSLLLVDRAYAWSDAGHKIIASIAFRQLTPAEQQAVIAILEQHPRFADDFVGKLPNDLKSAPEAARHEWFFQQAAIWPDMIRDYQGAMKDKYHRATWHYINRLHFLSAADQAALERTIKINQSLDPPKTAELTMNVVQSIRFARQLLRDEQAEAEEQAVLLSWLFHNVGDLHQPLHSTALFSKNLFPRGDRGGNAITTSQRSNLHAVWDQFPGNYLSFKQARDQAIEIVNSAESKAVGKRAAATLDEATWLDESHALAVRAVYTPEVMTALRHLDREAHTNGDLPPITLSKDYLRAGGNVSKQRLIEAGYRLGAVLKAAVATR